MPSICLDAHAQSCLPAVGSSNNSEIISRDGLDCRTPKWRGLSEAPRSTSLTTHYQVHPSFLCATSTWKPQSGSHFQSVFSKLMCTQSSWGFRMGHRPRWELKNHRVPKRVLSVVGKGNFPQALSHTMRRYIRFPATRIGEGLLAQPAQLPAGFGGLYTHCSDTEMVP